MSTTRDKHKKIYGTADFFQQDDEIISCAQVNPDREVDFYVKCSIAGDDTLFDIVTTVIFLAYSVFLIWLLAHLKGNKYYHLLYLVPFFLIVLSTLIICLRSDREEWMLTLRHLRLTAVVLTLMSTFTMLTRLAYFHLSHNQTIGTNFVIVSLKANILVFLWQVFARKRFSLTKIKADKDIITRLILDNVDIFNMIDILAMHSDLGIAEESKTEKAIQAFCSMSFLLICYESAPGLLVDDRSKTEISPDDANHCHQIWVHGSSLLIQNFPFFVIRLVFWAEYNVYNLGFLAKNGMAIVFGIAEIRSSFLNLEEL